MVSPTTENRKWPGFDHPGVHRSDRDLVHPGALDGAERVGAVDVAERRRVAGVAAHRVPAAGPVEVPDQPAGHRVIVRDDAEQVPHLPFEPAGGEGQPGQAGHVRVGRVAAQVQLDAVVRAGLGEQVHHPQRRRRRRARRSARPGNPAQQDPGGRHEFMRADGHRDAVLTHRFTGDRGGHGVVPVTMVVACSSSGASGPRVRPSTPQTTSAAISA